MAYEALATSKTPALIIFVIDISASMSSLLGGRKRIDVVMDNLAYIIQEMVNRSTKGRRIAPRYQVRIYAYSDKVYDLLEGNRTIEQLARMGVPELSPLRSTETASAFSQVEKLLERELPAIQDHPAPLICHITDGEYTGPDPQPVIERIKKMRVVDGNVLIENIFISSNVLREPVGDPRQWQGITPHTPIISEYGRKLREMSSVLPESYRLVLLDHGYPIQPGALMMLPGDTQEIVELGFVISASTPVAQ